MGVDDTIRALRDCICERLADSGAPVCTCSTSIGQPAVLCLGDCGCDTEGAGELWANLTRLYRGDRVTGGDVTPTRPCVQGYWYAQVRFTLARCYPTIGGDGNLPDPEDVEQAAATLHADAAELVTAINCCQVTDPAWVEGVSVDADPVGGCSVLTAMVHVPVSVRRGENERVVD